MKSYRSLNLLAVTTAVILSLALASPGVAQQRRGSGQVGSGGGACTGGVGTLFDQIEITHLNGDEESHIVYMREEEKLARDVYLTLADTWQLPIFGNIAGAEQRHMDALKRVLDLYEVIDPVVDDTVGIFVNTDLAELYSVLVENGSNSLVDALGVGATIEDLDLNDLLRGRIHGVSSEHAADMARLGLSNPTFDGLIRMRIHGVSADFAGELADAGLGRLSVGELVEMSIHGVTADFVREMADAGYDNLSSSRLRELRIHGVNPSFIRDMGELGLGEHSLNDYLEFRIHGVTPSYI